MSERMDRRKARTKQLMRNALLSLIEEQGIEGITVTDIATRADINRGTFYLHYMDVTDMLNQLKEEAFGQIRNILLQFDPQELISYADRNEPYPKLILIFEEFKRQSEFFKVMFGPQGDLTYINRYKDLKKHIYKNWQTSESNMLVPKDYLIAYMVSANLGVLLHWLSSGMEQSPHELGMIMTQLVNYGPLASSGLRDQPPL